MLNSDNQGFLTGEVITDIHRMTDHLSGIKTDVAAIRQAILSRSSSSGSRSNVRNSSNSSTPNDTRSTRQGQQNSSSASTANPVNPSTGSNRNNGTNQRNSSSGSSSSTTPGRDSSGRFVSNTDSNTVTPGGRDSRGRFTGGSQSENQQQASLLDGVADRIGNAINLGATDINGIDPTVQAFQEVAEPMKRGYQAFFGGGDRKERWYRKIFKELNLFRRDETVYNRAANRSLHNLENNPGSEGSDSSGFLGGAIGALFGRIAPLALTAIAGIGGVLLTSIGTVLGVIFSPIGLAIGAASALAWGLFTDDGHKFFADMGGKISDGWDKVTDWFIKSSPKTMEVLNKGAEKVSKAVEAVKKSSPKTTEAVGSFIDNIKDKAHKVSSYVTGKTSTNKAAMVAEMDAQGITDPKERAMMMAEVDHESGGFAYTKELGKDSYFDQYDAGTKKGARLGNTEKGDGLKYKGRGFIQLTGKSNYAEAGKDLGLDLINHPELAETPENAAKTAAWFWKKRKLGESARDGDVTKNRKIINGGTNGLSEVKRLNEKYLAESASNQSASIGSVGGESSIPMPTSPKIPTSPAIAESPGVVSPMGSVNQSTVASNSGGEIGQDVKSRPIALLATGGLSGRG